MPDDPSLNPRPATQTSDSDHTTSSRHAGPTHQTTVDTDEPAHGEGLFEDLLGDESIFDTKDVLRPAYTPDELPHREDQITSMATILAAALRGETPSNVLVYGKPGSGKTASATFVSQELAATAERTDVPCEVEYINCEVTDTRYRVLAQLANIWIETNTQWIDERLDTLRMHREEARTDPTALAETPFTSRTAIADRISQLEDDKASFEPVPMTGWPTDRVYEALVDALDYHERVVVIMLDEVDKLVDTAGDDVLYNLSRLNGDLANARVSLMGISNDLRFTDWLDPRVQSSLCEEEIVFPPYDAPQLVDILQRRAEAAFTDGVLGEDVAPLCAAFAAQEHGDARRALDLLRTAGELAERENTTVQEAHVRRAHDELEHDRIDDVVRSLPVQSKLVLFAILALETTDEPPSTTGTVFNTYTQLCDQIDIEPLTQRRVTDLVSELDMLGLANAVVGSKGRHGRTNEISLAVPREETQAVLTADSRLAPLDAILSTGQTRLGNRFK